MKATKILLTIVLMTTALTINNGCKKDETPVTPEENWCVECQATSGKTASYCGPFSKADKWRSNQILHGSGVDQGVIWTCSMHR